ncbi:MAG: hypothetical protein AAGI14_00880 [Pseudomonadota bacterium]
MANTSGQTGFYEAAWNQFVIEFRSWIGDVQVWMDGLTMAEKLIGISLFSLALLTMIVMKAKAKSDPGSKSRQFTTALILVVIFAFGTGWTLEGGSGSLSHLFTGGRDA